LAARWEERDVLGDELAAPAGSIEALDVTANNAPIRSSVVRDKVKEQRTIIHPEYVEQRARLEIFGVLDAAQATILLWNAARERALFALCPCAIYKLCVELSLGGSLIDERTQEWRSVFASRRANRIYGSYIRKSS
jgi:hypothetical protein